MQFKRHIYKYICESTNNQIIHESLVYLINPKCFRKTSSNTVVYGQNKKYIIVQPMNGTKIYAHVPHKQYLHPVLLFST